MIQEIGEGRFNPAYMRKNPQEDDILLHYEYNKVMLIKEGDRYRLPAFRDLKGEEDAVESVSYLFSIDSKGYYLADTFQMPEFGGFVMEGLQIFRSFEPMEDGFAGERAAGFAAAAGERWLRERKSVPWYALRAAIQNIPRSVRQ